jgi:arylsulfatase
VIATHGGRFNGWEFYLLGGRPVFHYNLADVHRFTVAAKEKLTPGEHVLVVEFAYDGGGIGRGASVKVTADDKVIAEGRVERSVAIRMSIDETLDIGEDTGTPVSED